MFSTYQDPETELKTKRLELAEIEKQFEALPPPSELSAKRAAIETELKSIHDQKNLIAIKYSQARALHDVELQILNESQSILTRETQKLELSRNELTQMDYALERILEEKKKVLELIENTTSEIAELKQKVEEIQSNGSAVHAQLENLRLDAQNVSKVLEVNQKVLLNAQSEYDQIKNDRERLEQQIEYDKSRSNGISNQIAVQGAINDKQRKLKGSVGSVNDISNSNAAGMNMSSNASNALSSTSSNPVFPSPTSIHHLI